MGSIRVTSIAPLLSRAMYLAAVAPPAPPPTTTTRGIDCARAIIGVASVADTAAAVLRNVRLLILMSSFFLPCDFVFSSCSSGHLSAISSGIPALVVFRQEIRSQRGDFLVSQTRRQRVHDLVLPLARAIGHHARDEDRRRQAADRGDIVAALTDMAGRAFRGQELPVGDVALELQDRGDLGRWPGVFARRCRGFGRSAFLYQKKRSGPRGHRPPRMPRKTMAVPGR